MIADDLAAVRERERTALSLSARIAVCSAAVRSFSVGASGFAEVTSFASGSRSRWSNVPLIWSFFASART